MFKKERYPHGGFTLIELLVVVLIIGILAAIALPQYRKAVGKAELLTLKTITRNVQDAAQRYYLINGTYVGAINNLDIEKPASIYCYIHTDSVNDRIFCRGNIAGGIIDYTVVRSTGKPFACLVHGDDRKSMRDRICKSDTGDKSGASSGVGWWYYYKN